MAIVKMSQIKTDYYGDHDRPDAAGGAWEYTGTTSGDSILIPPSIQGVTVTFTGTGYIETTTSKIVEIEAGTAIWVTWDYGNLYATETKTDVFYPVTAIRMTGTGTIYVRAQ